MEENTVTLDMNDFIELNDFIKLVERSSKLTILEQIAKSEKSYSRDELIAFILSNK